MKLNKALAALVLFALVTTVVGCTGGSGSTGGGSTGGYGTPPAGTSPSGSGTSTLTVVEKGFAFDPATLEVKVGDVLTFKNEDSAPHIVSIDGQELGNQEPGASVTWTASQAGTFPYTCTIHPAMAGEIVVK